MKTKFSSILCAFAIVFITTTSLESFIEKVDKIVAADELLAQNSSITNKYFFEFQNRTFIGYPNVYSPVIFPGAKKQVKLPLKNGDYFLEIGCGTGIFSVLAALEGADFVCAIDINSDAIANTIENAQLHNVNSKMNVLQGDMFSPLRKDEQFDVIFLISLSHIEIKTKKTSQCLLAAFTIQSMNFCIVSLKREETT